MDQDAIIDYIRETFEGVNILRPNDGPGAGDIFFIYDPLRNLEPKQQMPFATMVTKDYRGFDETSQLDRPGVFRLNVGVSRETFKAVAGENTEHDFAAFDRLMPHPVYASQSWLCVLNPGVETFERVKPLHAEAYDNASRRIASRRQ